MSADNTSSPEERLSASFDGEGSSDVDLSPEHQKQLRQHWEAIQSSIRSQPMDSVDISRAVAAEIGGTPIAKAKAPDRHFKWVLAVPGIVAVAAGAVFSLMPVFDSAETQRTATASVERILNQLPGGTDTAGWRVVVVNMPEEMPSQKHVESLLHEAKEGGADVVPVGSTSFGDAEYMAGLLLTDGHEAQEMLKTLSNSSGHVDWDPVEIDGRSSHELKELFLASMRVPSESEKTFGAMYVVDEESLAISIEPLNADTDNAAASDVLVAATDSEVQVQADVAEAPDPQPLTMKPQAKAVPSRSRDIAGIIPGDPERNVPVMIIFRRPTQHRSPSPNSDPGQGSLHAGQQTGNAV